MVWVAYFLIMHYYLVMQPKNSSTGQDNNYSFIELARRKQIIEATILVLAEHGFTQTSFAKIAQKAGINQSLLSYHFKDKAELIDQVRHLIYTERYAYVEEATSTARGSINKLEVFITTDIEYMSTHPEFFRALVEVLFGQRDANGMPQYMQDSDAPMFSLLQTILESGQEAGEFGNFDTRALAHVIEGAKDQFLAQVPFRPSLKVDEFTVTLLNVTRQFVQKEKI